MEKYTKKIIVDFNAEYPPQTIFVKQGDINSRCLSIEPQMNGDKIDIRSCDVEFHAQRPDRQFFIIQGTVTDEGNIYIELTDDIMRVDGMVKCDIKLIEEDQVLSSCLIHLNVVKSVQRRGEALLKDYGIQLPNEENMLSIPRGTTCQLPISLSRNPKWNKAARRSGYIQFENNDYFFFGIKKNPYDKKYIFKKLIKIVDFSRGSDDWLDEKAKCGSFNIKLTSEDTNIEPGIYYYSVVAELVSRDGKSGCGTDNSEGFYEMLSPTPFRITELMIKESDILEEYTASKSNRLISRLNKK